MALNPALRKAAETAKNKYSRNDGKTIKPKEGRNVYRIVAPNPNAAWLPADGRFWVDLGVHWIKPAVNGKPIAVVGSRDICYQEPCPIGTAIDMAFNQAIDDDSKAIFKEMKVSKSVLFNAIERTTKDDNTVVEILEVRPTVAQQIIDLLMQYDDAGQDITDPANGIDLVITRTGKGMNTEYTVNAKPGVSKPFPAEIRDNCHDLNDYIAKEYFRGEEQKALNFVQQLSGINMPHLVASNAQPLGLSDASMATVRTPTAALTSSAAAVDEVAAAAPASVAPAAVAPAAVAPAAVAPEPVQQVADATPAAPATAPASALPAEDIDAILKELDGI